MEISISRERVRTSRLASIKMDIINHKLQLASSKVGTSGCFVFSGNVDSKQVSATPSFAALQTVPKHNGWPQSAHQHQLNYQDPMNGVSC